MRPTLRPPARVRRSQALALALAAALAAGAARPARAATDDCAPTREVHDDGASLRLRPRCPLSLVDSSRALGELLAEAFPRGRMEHPRATLDVGRIVDHPWLSRQLAEAALRSPAWNAAKGRGRRSSDNHAVASMLDTRRLLAPWAPVFARYGLDARTASVEKVLVGEVGRTAELESLAARPDAAGRKLPFDAMLRLRLEPLPEPY